MDKDFERDMHDKFSESEADTKISHLQDKMYSREREGFMAWRSRHKLSGEKIHVDSDWNHPDESTLNFNPPKKSSVAGALLFAASLIFLIVAGAFGMNYLRTESAMVSARDVDLEVTGAQTILSGDVLELQLVIANRNDTVLELADLVIEYPRGARDAGDFTKDLVQERIQLGKLAANSVRRGTVRAVLFGTDGERQSVKLSLEYRVKGGDTIYTKDTTYAVVLTAGALALSVNANKEATTGQLSDLEVTVVSHSKTTLHDVLMSAEYPFGFSLRESAPEPTEGAVWELGDLYPGEARKVHIRGVLIGEEGSKRIFTFTAGTRVEKTLAKVETALIQYDHTMVVKKPFLSTELLINGESPETFSFKAGELTKAQVKWKNNLTTPVQNATIAVTLGGTALNKAGVKVARGFYRSADSLVIWDKQTNPESFANIAPGASGTIDFTIQPLPVTELQHIDNPSITFLMHAAGKRIGQTGVPENLQSTSTHEAKVGTDVTFAAKGMYLTSPFPKNGPLPPRVEFETIYAVQVDLSNTSNAVDGSEVTAILPPNVRWLGVVTPQSETVTFNDVDNKITWKVGSLASGTGVAGNPARSVAFAIGFVPSASQIHEAPDIVQSIKFKGTDAYTYDVVSDDVDDITTRLTEPGFTDKYATVVE